MYTKEQILLLDWLSSKKSGYIVSTKKIPNKFKDLYNLNVDFEIKQFIKNNILILKDDTVFLSDEGKNLLKEYDYILWIENHPFYNIT